MALMEIVAIILAAAALVVSFTSLYATALRGAEITVDPVLIWKELGRGGATNNVPTADRLRLCVVIANVGAHGGLLEDVRIAEVEYLGTSPQLWEGVTTIFLIHQPNWTAYD